MASNAIGEIPVLITGDLSDLDAAIKSAEQLASQGAGSIADAFNSVGTSAGTAGPQIQGVADSTQHAAESASEAATGLGGLSEAFEGVKVAIEALAIEKFGEEVLEAADNVQKLANSLTIMGASSEEAATALERIEGISKTVPFAQDQIENAARALAGYGIAAEKIPPLLQAAADSAAATGKGFDSVSQAIGRVATTGQLGSRQLLALGLQWQDVANQMGTSAKAAEAAFKQGAQDTATDVDILLQTLNAKFHGAAAAQAETIGGQFTLLRNQIDQAMQAIGTALTPVATAFLSFTRDVIVPLGESVVSTLNPAFQSLVGTISGTVNALTGLATGLKDLSGAFPGLTSAVGALSAAWSDLNAKWGGFPGVVDILIPGLTGVQTAVQLAAQKLTEFTHSGEDFVVTGTKVGAALQVVADQSVKTVAGLNALKKAQADANDAVTQARAVLDAVTPGTEEWVRANNNLVTALQAAQPYLAGLPGSLAAISGEQSKATDTFNRAFQAWEQVSTSYANGKANVDDLARAQSALTKTWEDAHPALVQLQKDAEDYAKDVDDAEKIIQGIDKAQASYSQSLETYNTILDMVQKGTIDATTGQAALAKAMSDVVSAFKAANPQLSVTATTIQGIGTAGTAAIAPLQQFGSSVLTVSGTASGLAVALPTVVDGITRVGTSMAGAAQVISAGGTTMQSVAVPIKAMGDAAATAADEWIQCKDAVTGAITVIQGVPSALVNPTAALTGQHAALLDLANSATAAKMATAEYINVSSQVNTVDADATAAAKRLADANFDVAASFAAAVKAAQTGMSAIDQAFDKSFDAIDASINGATADVGQLITALQAYAASPFAPTAIGFGGDAAHVAALEATTSQTSNAFMSGSGSIGRAGVTGTGSGALNGLTQAASDAAAALSSGPTTTDLTSAIDSTNSSLGNVSTTSNTLIEYLQNGGAQLLDLGTAAGTAATALNSTVSGATSIADASTALATSVTSVSQSLGGVAAVAPALSQVVAQTATAFSSLLATVPTPQTPTAPVLNPAQGGPASAGDYYSSHGAVVINTNVTGNTLLTQQGINTLADQVGSNIVSRLRTVAGLKI